jgi:hypothetical protein
LIKKPKPSKRELREFSLVIGAILVTVFGLLLPWLSGGNYPRWPWLVASILGATGLTVPRILVPVHKGWFAIGYTLAWINTRIVLGIVFFLVLSPIGIVARLLGYDPMRRYLDTETDTYRIDSKDRAKAHFERPF